MADLEIGETVRVSSAGHDGVYIREPYWTGKILWFSDNYWVGVRCENLGHSVHVVDRDKITQIET